MRKWMRERIQRRKKDSPTEPTKELATAPLQPAYFEPSSDQAAAPSSEAKQEGPGRQSSRSAASRETAPAMVATDSSHPTSEVSSPEIVSPTGANESSEALGSSASDQPSPSQGLESRMPRRRRGRGGRGRSSGQRTPTQKMTAAGALEQTEPTLIPGAPPSSATLSGKPDSSDPPAPRASKGAVILAIGLPGSGKSSWFKRHSLAPLSSDMLRAILFDDPTEQRFQDLIFSNLRSMLKARLIARRPLNYVDATNLTPAERASWIKLGKDYGYEVQAVFFDVPLEVCLQRNQKRQRVVPEDVMRRMAAKLKAPGFDEGFSKITVVKVKQKEEPAAV